MSVCPFDYQVLRASSPATDVLYLIFCCSSQEERTAHYKEYLQHYHSEFCKQLARYNLKPNLFPWADFLVEIKRCSTFALGMAMVVLPFLTCSDNDIPDAKDVLSGYHVFNDLESRLLFAERINGVLEDFICLGYI